MSTMIAEVYEALKEAGASEEKSKAASQAIADYEERISKANISMRELDKKMEVGFAEMKIQLTKIDGEIRVLKWMLGVLIAGIVSLILKSFLI